MTEKPTGLGIDPEVAALLTEVRVRNLDPADLNPLRELFAQSIEYLTREEYDETQRLAWLSTAEDGSVFEDKIWDGETFVAEVAMEIAGFATLKDSRIEMLYVHPHYTGRGLARKLVEALEQLAHARGATELTVEASDTARPVLAHLGFEPLERQLVKCGDQMLARTAMKKKFV